MCNYNEIMRPGFERMTSGVTSVISLKFCTKIFENVHLAYENSTKPIKKTVTAFFLTFYCLFELVLLFPSSHVSCIADLQRIFYFIYWVLRVTASG